MRKRLDEQPRYKNFINARDRALEKLLSNALSETSDILNNALNRVLEIITARYAQIPQNDFFTNQATQMLKLMEERIDDEFFHAAMQIYLRQAKMRRRVYMLSALGEGEAIGRTLEKPVEIDLPKEKLESVAFQNKGEDLVKRIRLSLNKLKREIMNAVELSRVQELSLGETIKKVIAAFPKTKATKRPAQALSRVREANGTPRQVASTAFASPEEWQEMLNDYKSTYLPKKRFYNEPLDWTEGDTRFITYAWEVEENLTHDFVEQVRDAQSNVGKQARKNGIADFVWIAVVDDKTDECCTVRDGLTTEEIKNKIESGAIDSDLCDAIVPPAHFNCRCRLAPIADADDLPEKPEFEYEDFQSWLEA